MRKVLNFVALMKELLFIFDVHLQNKEVFCKVFKDNQICITVEKYNKLSSRTKHIYIKYHHYQSFVQKKIIQIGYIDI